MGSRRGRGEPPISAIATSDWSAADGGGDSCRPRRLTSRRPCGLFEAEVLGPGAAPVLNNKKNYLSASWDCGSLWYTH
jgi:hypothetical protein